MVANRWIETATGDVFKDGARMLQFRLRKHLRVAVDTQRARLMLSEDYFSHTLQRWLNRFREFRRDSLPSSPTFYRKTVSNDIDLESDSLLTRVLQAVAVPVLGNVCHVFMHGLNCVQIYGAEKLNLALLHRPENKGLITVSNHVAAMDDPLVIASLLPPSVMLDAHNLRWTLCATDRCFRNPVTSAFFKYLKVLPVSRGDGIFQKDECAHLTSGKPNLRLRFNIPEVERSFGVPSIVLGMDIAISKLNKGGWVHIFPEGSRSRDGGKSIGSIKKGVVRLVLDADNVPIVLPFVHTGMQDVMPIGAKVPRIGKTVTVLIGDPIRFDDILKAEEQKIISRVKLYDAICARIGDSLRKLKVQVERIAIEQSLQLQNYPAKITEKSAKILTQVDWESLGNETDYNNSSKDYHHHHQVNSMKDQSFSTRPFWVGGIMSRIKGYNGHSMNLMGLAIGRELFMKYEVKNNGEFFNPLKIWNSILEGSCDYSPVAFLAANS